MNPRSESSRAAGYIAAFLGPVLIAIAMALCWPLFESNLKLPRVDGLEVLQKVPESERTRSLPIVVFTSSSEQQDIIKSFGLGANSYVRKPVDFEQFVEATKQLGMYWLVLNEAPPRQGEPS